MNALYAYACRVRGCDHETVVNATSRGRAKREFLLGLDIDGITFTDIRARRVGPAVTTEGIKRVAEYRGVPFARAGMLVEVGGDRGRIVGHNSSANFDVLFEQGRWAGPVLNCHPLSEIVYLNDATTCSYSSAKVDTQTIVEAMQKARRWMERTERREREVLTIAGRLMMAGITGDRYRLAECLWMAEQCFERSLEALAQHHRLGCWAQKRLA